MAPQDQAVSTATRTIPVYQALAEDIKAMGVDCVFGLMSDDTAHFGVTLDAIGIKFIGARHENIAVVMADGYAAATGRLTVVCIGRGPALANGLHGVTFASRTGNPLLVIYGEAPQVPAGTNTGGPDYKGLDQAGVLKAAGIKSFTPTTAGSARQMLADAAATAAQGQTVAYLMPVDVQLREIEVSADEPPLAPICATPLPRRKARPAPDCSCSSRAFFGQEAVDFGRLWRTQIRRARGIDRAGGEDWRAVGDVRQG
jgi:thiamine pyrophosphate-dependent acetolactate synthase large subunit-like protein